MKMWLISENWLPAVGGVSNYLSQLTAELARQHDMRVFASAEETANDPSYVERVKFASFWRRPRWSPLFHQLTKRAQGDLPDVLLCGKALFEGRLALRLKRKLNIPYVIFTYAMEVETWAQNDKHKQQLSEVLQEAAVVVYINERTKETLRTLGVQEKQLFKLTPGVGDRFLREVRPELAESTARHYGITSPYVLSVGRLVERKGFDLLLRAFANLDQTKFGDVELVLIGNGPERSELETIIEREFLSTSVKILEDVPDKHLPPLYAGAELFVLVPRELPGDYEGFGIVYLEAGAVGTPSIGAQTGGVPEAVQDQVTGLLIEPDNEQQLTERLEELLGDSKRRTQLGEAAKKNAEQQTWDAKATALVTRLQNL